MEAGPPLIGAPDDWPLDDSLYLYFIHRVTSVYIDIEISNRMTADGVKILIITKSSRDAGAAAEPRFEPYFWNLYKCGELYPP